MLPDFNPFVRKDGVVIINSTIHNDYFDRYLAILMVNPDYNGIESMKIFVYSLIDF